MFVVLHRRFLARIGIAILAKVRAGVVAVFQFVSVVCVLLYKHRYSCFFVYSSFFNASTSGRAFRRFSGMSAVVV